MADDDFGDDEQFDDEEFDGESADDFEEIPLDEHETALIQQDLSDLADFEATFRPEGYRGVAVWCHDCAEEHYYPWDMLRENLQLLIDTGETPVHEPAFAPEPDRYIQWEYARGYVDALRDAGVQERVDLNVCNRCGFRLPDAFAQGNFCPRCGNALLAGRLAKALEDTGMGDDDIAAFLRRAGLPG